MSETNLAVCIWKLCWTSAYFCANTSKLVSPW